MRICIPTETDNGLKANVFGHFGSAPFFTIVDSVDGSCEVVQNGNTHHIHGSCNPVDLLKEKDIEAVVCLGMGMRAVQLLNSVGIKAYMADAQTVEAVIARSQLRGLREITVADACNQHNCGG